MKTISLFFLCFPLFSLAQQINYFEGSNTLPVQIDTGANQVWKIGKPQKLIFDSSYSRPNALLTDTSNRIQGFNRSSFRFRAFFDNPFLLQYFVVIWQQKTDLDFKKAGGVLETSFDDGASWMNVKLDTVYRPVVAGGALFDTLTSGEIGITGTDSLWRGMMLCWRNSMVSPVFPPSDHMDLRFTYSADSNAAPKEGWMIDNLEAFYTLIDENKSLHPNQFVAVKAYPNPTSEFLNVDIKLDMSKHINVQLHSNQGSLLYSSDKGVLPPGLHSFRINCSQLAHGSTYFLTTRIGNQIQMRRMTK